MSFSSTLNVLVVEKREVTSRKSGQKFNFVTARCALLNDAGEVTTVGALRVPPALEEKVKPGIFRAGFALQVPDWGDEKGDIVAVLTDVTPVQLRAAGPAPAAAGKAS